MLHGSRCRSRSRGVTTIELVLGTVATSIVIGGVLLLVGPGRGSEDVG